MKVLLALYDSRVRASFSIALRLKDLAVTSVAVEEEYDRAVPLVDLVVWLDCVALEIYAQTFLGHIELADKHVIHSLRTPLRETKVVGWIGCLNVGIACDNEVDIRVSGKEVGHALEVLLLCFRDVVAVNVKGDGGLQSLAETHFFIDFRHHHVGIVEFFVCVACHLCKTGEDI